MVMLWNIFAIGSRIDGVCIPSIEPSCVKQIIHICICSRITYFAGVVPFEDTVAGDAATHESRGLFCQIHLQVAVGSDEASAVSAATLLQGEGDHVAALELEALDAVVPGFGHILHVTAAVVPFGEAVVALTAEAGPVVEGQRTGGSAVGQDDGTAIVDFHLTVGVVLGVNAVDLDVAQVALGLCGFQRIEDDHGVVGVDNVDGARRCERCGA